MPVVQAVRVIQKALHYRRFHEECMQKSYPKRGRITNITKEEHFEYTSRNRRRRIIEYYLHIEIINNETGVLQTIKSEAYRIPIYKYLASPYVQVYTDESGWKYVIDGFELKKNRNDPDLPLENSNVYSKDFDSPSRVMNIIVILVMIFMLFRILGVN